MLNCITMSHSNTLKYLRKRNDTSGMPQPEFVRVAGLSLQPGHYSSLTAPNLLHTANQE